jgi:primosomal protein N' (replication factor Y)
VQLVDLKTAPKYNGIHYFSQELEQEIASTLLQKKQAILFLNRKGFAPLVYCKSCNNIFQCPHCSVPITWHSHLRKLLCHHCLYSLAENFSCPHCQKKRFALLGLGIEKIERLLGSVFPKARVLRIDSDSIANQKTLQQYLHKIQNFEVDIVIGTQIITKGHHFPNVALCGVFIADSGFQRQEYRGTEKTFQLLSQLIGRAGREVSQIGKTIVQSYQPQSQFIKYAVEQNFADFYHFEMEKRKHLQQPPFTHWILLKISSKKENTAKLEARKIFAMRKANLDKKVEILGPVAAIPYKLNDWFCWEIILQSASAKILRQAFQKEIVQITAKQKRSLKIKIIVDP